MALASSSYTLGWTSTNYMMRDLKLFMRLDIVIPTNILNLNSWSFNENLTFTACATNNLLIFSHIYFDESSKSIWCNSKSDIARPIMTLTLSSLLCHSKILVKSHGAVLVPFTIPHKFLFISCLCIFTFHVWKLKLKYFSNDISMDSWKNNYNINTIS
jgi:hypothetical protein